jgi:hypothetical protein
MNANKHSTLIDLTGRQGKASQQTPGNGNSTHLENHSPDADTETFDPPLNKTEDSISQDEDSIQNIGLGLFECDVNLFLNQLAGNNNFNFCQSNDIGTNVNSDDNNGSPTQNFGATRYQIPQGLRKPFRIPFLHSKNQNQESNDIPIITRQAKQSLAKHGKILQIPNAAQGRSFPKTTTLETSNPTTHSIQHTENTSTSNLVDNPYIDATNNEDEHPNKTSNHDDEALKKCNGTAVCQATTEPLTSPNKISLPQNINYIANAKSFTNHNKTSNHTGKLHCPKYLDDSLKPNTIIELPPDLESLRQFIISQPEAFTPHLKELGQTILSLSKLIHSKKESLLSLTQHKKIPRSLRIKCELSTSPDYALNPDFLRLKEELQNTVHEFITNGTKIMIEWAEHNIKLLLKD